MPNATNSSYQNKLEQLRAAKLRVEHKLQTSRTTGWGEDTVMWRQALLDELSSLDEQILRISNAMENAANHPTYKVELNGKMMEIKIVPQDLVSPREGYISESSPLAQALTRASAGEEVEIATPRGTTNKYRLLG